MNLDPYQPFIEESNSQAGRETKTSCVTVSTATSALFGVGIAILIRLLLEIHFLPPTSSGNSPIGASMQQTLISALIWASLSGIVFAIAGSVAGALVDTCLTSHGDMAVRETRNLDHQIESDEWSGTT